LGGRHRKIYAAARAADYGYRAQTVSVGEF